MRTSLCVCVLWSVVCVYVCVCVCLGGSGANGGLLVCVRASIPGRSESACMWSCAQAGLCVAVGIASHSSERRKLLNFYS